MLTINKYITESVSNGITFTQFDKQYYKLLPSDKNMVYMDKNHGKYHTIILNDGTRVGFCGVYINPKFKDSGFFQIYIDSKFRGKPQLQILRKSADFLFNKYKLKQMTATIKKSNIASVKSHKKNGFKEIDKVRRDKLIKLGKLKSTDIILEYIP